MLQCNLAEWKTDIEGDDAVSVRFRTKTWGSPTHSIWERRETKKIKRGSKKSRSEELCHYATNMKRLTWGIRMRSGGGTMSAGLGAKGEVF